MAQALKALHYMHSGGVVHRDLKPSNILVDDTCHARLADFGLARSTALMARDDADDIDPTMTDYIATRWYRWVHRTVPCIPPSGLARACMIERFGVPRRRCRPPR